MLRRNRGLPLFYSHLHLHIYEGCHEDFIRDRCGYSGIQVVVQLYPPPLLIFFFFLYIFFFLGRGGGEGEEGVGTFPFRMI